MAGLNRSTGGGLSADGGAVTAEERSVKFRIGRVSGPVCFEKVYEGRIILEEALSACTHPCQRPRASCDIN